MLPCRMLGKVAVKGKMNKVLIYSVRRQLSPAEQEGWGLHAQGMDLYYSREFEKAESCFEGVRKCLPGDEISAEFAKRCRKYLENPPEPGWEGVEVIAEK
jgi:hypothetical protein